MRAAAADCDFGEAADINRRIREQILMNGNNIKLWQRAVAKLMEDSLRQIDDMKSMKDTQVKDEPDDSHQINKVRTRRYLHLNRSNLRSEGQQNKNQAGWQRQRKDTSKVCQYYGLEFHKNGRCPASRKNCRKCRKINHFARV